MNDPTPVLYALAWATTLAIGVGWCAAQIHHIHRATRNIPHPARHTRPHHPHPTRGTFDPTQPFDPDSLEPTQPHTPVDQR